ncbi:MAG: hypothetical protein RSA29_17055 [Clostridium sp.]|uniref:hypothetical protein n=1 Tax=Clostridium sp. TaxID=1506 RepID=UPI00305717AC
MTAILFIMLMTLVYTMFLFKFNNDKKDNMCVEKCNMKDCKHCIDKGQCKYGKEQMNNES